MRIKEIIMELTKQVSDQGYTIKFFNNLSQLLADKETNYKIRLSEDINFIELYDVHKPVPDIIKKITGESNIDISESTCDLTWIADMNVTSLILFYTSYQELPDEFSKLKSLENLRLVSSGLSHMPDVIRKLTNLRSIQISNVGSISQSNHRPFTLPNWLSELPNLERLDLDCAYIQSIPADLIRTKMDFTLENASGEKGVHLFGTTLVEGDISLFAQPRNIIEAYYFGPQKITRECKVIFLGEGKSGKSSLIERLINDTFEENKLPTEGIRMQTWPIYIGQE